MKYCQDCRKEYDTDHERCPVCGALLSVWPKDEPEDEPSEGETVATMTLLGLL